MAGLVDERRVLAGGKEQMRDGMVGLCKSRFGICPCLSFISWTLIYTLRWNLIVLEFDYAGAMIDLVGM